MGKKTVFTNITPLPPGVSREVAVAMLHNHDEMIELNPLVIEHHPIKTPRDAAKDEFLDCAWQEMTDRIHYLPGGIVKGKVTYKGCFHDLPNGLSTHVYAPMSLNIRERWIVGGTLPGEPEEPRELGLNLPRRGLYLREDCEMKCNVLMTSFVRKNLDNAHKVLVERILAKAERVQAHLDSASSTPASSVPPSTPSFQRGSHMESSNIVKHLSDQRPSTARSTASRTPSDSATVQSVRAPQRKNFVSELPASTPDDLHRPLPNQPEQDEIDEAELQTVHPALREQYRRSRSSGNVMRSDTVLPTYHSLQNQQGQFYQNDLAKKNPGKQFVVELEGSSPESLAMSSKPPLPIDLNSYVIPNEDSEYSGSRPRTTYGATSEVSDESLPRNSGSRPESRTQPRSASDGDTFVGGSSSSKNAMKRYSVISGISEMPTPKVSQFDFNNTVDSRFSVVSAMTEAPTPRFSDQTFAEQQAFAREQARQAQARGPARQDNMF